MRLRCCATFLLPLELLAVLGEVLLYDPHSRGSRGIIGRVFNLAGAWVRWPAVSRARA